jgi:DNA-binding CsgD family transcriptional regulator/PAS domain-containing protein
MDPAFAQTLQAFIDAAVEGEGWTRPLTMAERALGVRGVIIQGYERFGDACEAVIEASRGVPQEGIEPYERHYVNHDVRSARAVNFPVDMAVCDYHVGDPTELDRSMVDAEFYRPLDVGRFVAVQLNAARTHAGADRRVFLTLLKPNNAEAPTERESEQALTLAHVVRASLRTAAAMSALRAENEAKSAALDRAAFGCAILDARGRVLDVNAAARCILARDDGLSIRRGRLRARDSAAQDAIDQACAARVLSPPGAKIVRAARAHDARPYALMLISLRRDVGAWLAGGGGSAAIALIVDPDQRAADPAGLWRAAFGLTAAESAVANLLVAGCSQREIADARGVALHTVHTQIKRLYAKLDAVSQGQAVSRLMRAAPFDD